MSVADKKYSTPSEAQLIQFNSLDPEAPITPSAVGELGGQIVFNALVNRVMIGPSDLHWNRAVLCVSYPVAVGRSNCFDLFRRQALLQYLTSLHVLAHLRRQVIGRLQTTQILVSCRFIIG